MLVCRAVSVMQSVVRGRLARRQFKTEQNLKVIKNAHFSLMLASIKNKAVGSKANEKYSKTSVPGGPVADYNKKVFWYTVDEEKVLYSNYLELVARTGHSPPRTIVEANIHEITQRILVRQYLLITLIQRRWRGFMVRRVVRLYRYEVIRLRQIWTACVLKIQRVYRGHMTRIHVSQWVIEEKHVELLKRYREERLADQARAKGKDHAAMLKRHYRKERAVARTARATSVIGIPSDYSTGPDKPLRLFAPFTASCYADERIPHKILSFFKSEIENDMKAKMQIKLEQERQRYIWNRVNNDGPRDYGYRCIPPIQMKSDLRKASDGLPVRRPVADKELIRPSFPLLPPRLATSAAEQQQQQLQSASPTSLSPSQPPRHDGDGQDDTDSGSARVNQVHGIEALTKHTAVVDQAGHRDPDDAPAMNHSQLRKLKEDKMTSSRSKGMQILFRTELGQLLEKSVDRISKEVGTKRETLRSRFKEHNNLPSSSRYKYKFPKDINVNPMDFLNEDLEYFALYQDKKAAASGILS